MKDFVYLNRGQEPPAQPNFVFNVRKEHRAPGERYFLYSVWHGSEKIGLFRYPYHEGCVRLCELGFEGYGLFETSPMNIFVDIVSVSNKWLAHKQRDRQAVEEGNEGKAKYSLGFTRWGDMS